MLSISYIGFFRINVDPTDSRVMHDFTLIEWMFMHDFTLIEWMFMHDFLLFYITAIYITACISRIYINQRFRFY